MSFSLLSNIPSPSFIQTIKNKIEPLNFPECPGVYVMVNQSGKVSYTGKAKNLRDRIYAHVRSSHNLGVEDDIAKHNIKEIMVFCCDTELDAIVLERYFIQSSIYCGIHNKQYASSLSNSFSKTNKEFTNKLFNENANGIHEEEIIALKNDLEGLEKKFQRLMSSVEERIELREDNSQLIDQMIKLMYEVFESIVDLRKSVYSTMDIRRDLFIEKLAEMSAEQQIDNIVVNKRIDGVRDALQVVLDHYKLEADIRNRQLKEEVEKYKRNKKGNFLQRLFKIS